MFVNEEQPSKQYRPNEVTDDGSVIEVKLLQSSKQEFPIEVTEDET